MFRYVALLPESQNETQQRLAELIDRDICSAPDWHRCFHGPGLHVYCADIEPKVRESYSLARDAGVVLGTVFRRATSDNESEPVSVFDSTETELIVRTGGRALVERYWGKYVAFIVDPSSNVRRVMKDPTGNLPCYGAIVDGLGVFFSCAADCIEFQIGDFSVDWSYVAARITGRGVDAGTTGLSNVAEIYGGECIELRGSSRTSRFYWNPIDYSKGEALEDPQAAAQVLNATVKSCVRSWASKHCSVVHRLSGGLDSAIVLGCLRDAQPAPQLTCITSFLPNGKVDKRRWAALAAKQAQCAHVVHARDPQTDFTAMLSIVQSCKPEAIFPRIETGGFERRVAKSIHATAVFSGDGGDGLFGRNSIPYALRDYVIRRGLNRNAFGIAVELALREGKTVWHVLSDALSNAVFRHELPQERALTATARQLIKRDLLTARLERPSHPHPWFAAANPTPWDVVHQVPMLLRQAWFYDPFTSPRSDYAEPIFPLLSQPVVELCLRIPIYVHFLDGRDRGLARLAFSREVPSQILGRYWKDRAPGYFEEMIRCNLSFVREFLFDGQLVQRGLLEKRQLDSALSDSPTKSGSYASELLDYLTVEAWLHSWSRHSRRAAAAA
jgi:asparagine synthase (glutamine-hydrolysing)